MLFVINAPTVEMWMHDQKWYGQLVYLTGAWLCHSAYAHVLYGGTTTIQMAK